MPEPREDAVRHSGHSRGMTSVESGAFAQLDRIVYYYLHGGMSSGHSMDEIREVLAEIPAAQEHPVLSRVAAIVEGYVEPARPPLLIGGESMAQVRERDIAMHAYWEAGERPMAEIEEVLRTEGLLPTCVRDEARR